MRYSYKFKVECVELYRKGVWKETPKGVKRATFRKKIIYWNKLTEIHGDSILKHRKRNRRWSAEEKLQLISKYIAGSSCEEICLAAGINMDRLYCWVNKYKELGYNGLVNQKRGRVPNMKNNTKNIRPKALNESEREELIRLREENEYLRTEQAVLKKLDALRKEKYAAYLKAKKQHL